MGNSVPGGWFIGRPASSSREEEEPQPQAAATEPKPAMAKRTPRDYFAGGTPEYLGPQAASEPAERARELTRFINSFMKLYSWFTLTAHLFINLLNNSPKVICCRVLPASCIGVNAYNVENKHNRRSDNPSKLPFERISKLPFERIKLITNNFSEELGRGSFGQVFKGVLEDGEEVAVKMLYFMPNINDQQFENEFEILKLLKHPNIVRLVGFCDEAKEELVEYNGKLIVCQRIHRALCLEYMPNGSLGKLLTGENIGKEWTVRHKIIMGICKGLEYLQEGLESPIFHLDLKPDNILLNEEMMPKISDFGLSRLIGEENSKKTLTPLGTLGYLPPEFINYQVISKEYDIYSLGVIITKTITGTTSYSDVADMDAEEFIEHVHENWKKCLQEIPRYESLEVDCKQVKRCIEIARRCMENDRHKRPTIKEIMSQLDEIEMGNSKLDSPLQLGEEPAIVPVASEDGDFWWQDISFEDGDSWFQDIIPSEDGDSWWQDIIPSEDGDSWWQDTIPCEDGILNDCHMRSEEMSIGHKSIRRLRLRVEEVSSRKHPPSDITHPACLEQKPKLMTDAGEPYLGHGCKEPGYGPRCEGVNPCTSTGIAPAQRIVCSVSTLWCFRRINVLPLLGSAISEDGDSWWQDISFECGDCWFQYIIPSEDGDSWWQDIIPCEVGIPNDCHIRSEEMSIGRKGIQRLRLRVEELSSRKHPPSDIAHPARPEEKPKLMADAGAPYLRHGCKEPGYGPRCEGGQSLHFHKRCTRAEDPLFGLHTLEPTIIPVPSEDGDSWWQDISFEDGDSWFQDIIPSEDGDSWWQGIIPSEDEDSWWQDIIPCEEGIPNDCHMRSEEMSIGYKSIRRLRLRVEEVSSRKYPPSDMTLPASPEHKPKLMTDAGAPYLCHGCKEPGYGPRCGGGQSLDLHTRCARAEDPLFGLRTLVLPLFGYGKKFEFRFLHEAPSSSSLVQYGTRVCDACGEPTRGFVYHCSDEQGLNLHPCCAYLPDRLLHDGRAFDLNRRASRPCALCPENEGHSRWFWAYRCNLDGDEAAVELHVACLKETARQSWDGYYCNQDVGDGALNVDGMLENMFTNKFGEIAGTVASFITALVFGNLIVKV